ncbi:MAG: hypothetical protein QOE70_5900 [Chthoniobacter sp.]|jgi:mono/diheme cytochrome c family protein|nr:hypothetical protein [Chthoniobacter sp.]
MRAPAVTPTFIAAAAAALGVVLRGAGLAAEPAKPVDFTLEVAPIFEARCVRCHNTTEKKGKFSLATAADVFTKRKGHEAAVVPGDPGASLLVELITPPRPSEDPEMPEEGDPLTAEQVALVRRWIEEGAKWPEGIVIRPKARAEKATWWALQPLRSDLAPEVEEAPADWTREPIDRFVFAKLAEKGLKPSPPAEPREFIRRATFDLTGLPPTPDEVEAFAADSIRNPQSAILNLLDRLLASPRYGERWGRHWLDVVRFGESSGFERNLVRDNAWPFRDYVIRSLNDDKPFDRFMMEHLAGDQLAQGDPWVEIGSAFLVAGPYDDVGNQDAKAAAQIRANTLDDIVAATGSAFLGLTVNCARCHDHKFDPIEQADYYRLQAAFAGVQQGPREWASREEREADQQRRGPIVAALEETKRELAAIEKAGRERVPARREELLQRFTRPPVKVEGNEETFDPIEARFVRGRLDPANTGRPVVLEECEIWSAEPEPRNVALASAGAKITATGTRVSSTDPTAYAPANLIDGSFARTWNASSKEPPAQFVIELPRVEKIARLVWTQDREQSRRVTAIEDYLFEASLDGQTWTKLADPTARRPATPAGLEEALLTAALEADERARRDALKPRRDSLQAELDRLPKLPTAWLGKLEQPRAPAYLMRGGDPQKRGPEIAPASLSMLDHGRYELPLNAPEGGRRLALAKWLVASDNPLTPRVLANRVWHYHFGTGIVDTPSDFGYMGGRPTHPELLDYLAQRLQHHGWRLKPLHREIMLSQTYRQSAQWRKEGADVDFATRLLWRFPPRRLSAEEVRDTMLSIAGKLDLRMGGPGFRLYRYLNDNVSTYVPLDNVGPETYRRAVYHQNARAATVDLMSEFDAPDCASPTPRRASTTTPLQALTLFNHSFTLDLARALAERLHAEAGEDATAQVRRAFALGYGRAPSAEEETAAAQLIATHGLPAFCRAVLNSNELIHVR